MPTRPEYTLATIRSCLFCWKQPRVCSCRAAELQGHLRHLWKDQKIGILCADEKNFTQHLYDTCGVFLEDQALCIVAGARHLPEFSALLERRGHFHNGLLRQELIGLGRALVSPP